MPKIVKYSKEKPKHVICRTCYCEISYKNHEVFDVDVDDDIVKEVIICPNCNKYIIIRFKPNNESKNRKKRFEEYIKKLRCMPYEEAKIESINNLLAGIIDINGSTVKEYI